MTSISRKKSSSERTRYMTKLISTSTARERHNRLTERVKSERKITDEVLQDILLMESLMDYAELGYPSMFEYLVRGQKYSEGSAQRRLSAARLLKDIPEIQLKIQEGSLNLTQLVKLSIAVKQEQKVTGAKVSTRQKKDLLQKIENKNGIETEKLLTQELQYTPKIQEKVIPQDKDYFLTLKLTAQQYAKLKKAQSFLSHSHYEGGFAEIIETLCDKLIQSKERNSQQGKSVSDKILSKTEPPTATTAVKNTYSKVDKKRIYIPVPIQRKVFQRSKYCCEYVSSVTGHRCNSTYQLQIDHIVPIAKGGGNEIENLRNLCRTHNLSEARRMGLGVNISPQES